MAGRPVLRHLPDLLTAVDFTGFATDENRTARVTAMLRDLALRLQGSDPIPFYAMRAVARSFGVSLSTVSVAYRHLEREGLLIRRRSALTELQPKQVRARVHRRGLVCVPIYTAGFITFTDLRQFYASLEARLSAERFVTSFVFFGHGRELLTEFVDQILAHEPEIVLWLQPADSDRSVLLSLADAGIQVVVVGDVVDASPRGLRYRLSWRDALERGLDAWKRDDVECIIVPHADPENVTSVTGVCLPLLRSAGLRWEIRKPQGQNLSRYIESLGAEAGTGVIFDDDLWFEILCRHDPQAVAKLLERARVMVTRLPNLSQENLVGRRLDRLVMDWESVAARLATDIASGKAFERSRAITFHARFTELADAAALAHHYDSY